MPICTSVLLFSNDSTFIQPESLHQCKPLEKSLQANLENDDKYYDKY